MNQIEVFRIGAPVKIGSGITGVITGVTIRQRLSVLYEVDWWDGRTRNSEYFAAFQVELDESPSPLKIGFVSR